MPGEFILAPGNLAPVGIAVALPPSLLPMRGEFRLGPGLAQPPGITRPLPPPMTRVEPLYAAGEFILGPGNLAPLGIVVPLYDTARARRVPARARQQPAARHHGPVDHHGCLTASTSIPPADRGRPCGPPSEARPDEG